MEPLILLPDKAIENGIGAVIAKLHQSCEHFDEMARAGTSLYGETAEQRAETRMWLRRIDLEICQPIIAWFRNDPATLDVYKGNRLPTPEARVNQKIMINQALNMLDDRLEGNTWLCGERFSAADIHFYGLMKMMTMQVCQWMLLPGRENFLAYWKRLDEREASQKALQNFPAKVTV